MSLRPQDRFTQYGLIGAAWVNQDCIEHLVMSCRALGLGIEEAFLGALSRPLAAAGFTELSGRLVPTEANLACRQIFARNGFTLDHADRWVRPLSSPFHPAHLELIPPPDV